MTSLPVSLVLNYLSRVLFFLINLFALVVFLKGHNAPGGGFIAGVISGLSFVLIGITFGTEKVKQILKFDALTISSIGLLFAFLTGTASMVFHYPFLYQKMIHLHLPILGDLHVGTPLLFDLGVFLVVVGVITKIYVSFDFSIRHNSKRVIDETGAYSPNNEGPIDS